MVKSIEIINPLSSSIFITQFISFFIFLFYSLSLNKKKSWKILSNQSISSRGISFWRTLFFSATKLRIHIRDKSKAAGRWWNLFIAEKISISFLNLPSHEVQEIGEGKNFPTRHSSMHVTGWEKEIEKRTSENIILKWKVPFKPR